MVIGVRILYCFFAITFLSSCATSYSCDPLDTSERMTLADIITSDEIQAITEGESESKLHLQAGDYVTITAKKEFSISPIKVEVITMIVEDANSMKIRGKIVFTPGEKMEVYEDVAGHIAEVKLVDIRDIIIWDKVMVKNKETVKRASLNEGLGGDIADLFLVLWLLFPWSL